MPMEILSLLSFLAKNICRLSEKPVDKEKYFAKTYYPRLNWKTINNYLRFRFSAKSLTVGLVFVWWP